MKIPPEININETAELIVTMIRVQDWKNGGVLMIDHQDAVELVAQALRTAESCGAVNGAKILSDTVDAAFDRLEGKGGTTQ